LSLEFLNSRGCDFPAPSKNRLRCHDGGGRNDEICVLNVLKSITALKMPVVWWKLPFWFN